MSKPYTTLNDSQRTDAFRTRIIIYKVLYGMSCIHSIHDMQVGIGRGIAKDDHTYIIHIHTLSIIAHITHR